MKRISALLPGLMLTVSLVSGCAFKTGGAQGRAHVPKPSLSRPKAVVLGVPFSRLNAPPLDTVDFVSTADGYVGGRGVILKTVDGGQTWVKVYSGPENVLEVDAIDQNDVWAATDKGYLLYTTDGEHFQPCPVPVADRKKGSPKGIQEIEFFTDHCGYILACGEVKRLTAGRQWGGTTPPVPIDSISFPDSKTGFAAGANLVYKTTDGGKSWHKIFTIPVKSGSITGYGPAGPWHAVIAAGTPTNAWLLVYGGAAGMSQVAYVVFHTTDGKNFSPVMDEGYWSTAYPQIHLPATMQSSGNLGLQPGPFTVLGANHAWFIGLAGDQGPGGPQGYAMLLTRTDDDGVSFHKTGLGRIGDPAAPDLFLPMAVSFVDSAHGWVVGGHGDHGAVMYTTNGQTFRDAP